MLVGIDIICGKRYYAKTCSDVFPDSVNGTEGFIYIGYSEYKIGIQQYSMCIYKYIQ